MIHFSFLAGIRTSVSRRAFARVRASCPLVPVTLGLVVGQMLAWLGFAYVGLAVVICFFSRWSRSALGAPFVLGVAAGCLSLGLLVAGLSEPLVPGERRFAGEIVEGPRRRVPGGVQFEVQVLREFSEGESLLRSRILRCRAVDLPWREVDGMVRGDTFVFLAHVQPVSWNSNPFSYEATLLRHGVSGECRVRYAARLARGVPGFFERVRERIKDQAIAVLGNHERAGLVLALTLGEHDSLSLRTEAGFRAAGLSHLLVLSGYQVSLVYALLFGAMRVVLRLSGLRGAWWVRLPALASFLFTTAFVALVGFDSSSLRAAIAMVLVVAGRLSERSSSLWTSILGSLCILLLLYPGALFEPGVQLTYGALAGIALGAEGGKGKVETFLSVSFWATLIPLALAAVWFGAVSLGGLLLNPALAPVLSVSGTLVGGGALVLSAGGLDRPGFLLDVVAHALTLLRELVVQCARLPGVYVECGPWEGALILGLVAILVGLRARGICQNRLKALNFMHHSPANRNA